MTLADKLLKAFGKELQPTKIVLEFMGITTGFSMGWLLSFPFIYQYSKSLGSILLPTPVIVLALLVIWTVKRTINLYPKTKSQSGNQESKS